MGIPRKDTKANSHFLVQALKAFGEGLMSIPRALKEVPNLPKSKLLKLTGFFFGGSLAVYYIMGPYQKIRYMRYVSMVSKNWLFDSNHCFCRHYSKGEELLKIYGEQPVTSIGPGNEKPFSQSYGLDYREVIDSSKSSSTGTEESD